MAIENMKNVRVCDIASAKFQQEDSKSFVTTSFGEKISRIKIVGCIVEKFLNENNTFGSVSIDDGTGIIQVRAFGNNLDMIKNSNAGELVMIIGNMKNYKDENYVFPDFIKRLDDPNKELLFRMEVLKDVSLKKEMVENIRRMFDKVSEEGLQEYALEKYNLSKQELQTILETKEEKIDHKPMMLELIEKLDEGEGVEIAKLLEASNLDEGMAESTISDLISSGEVYEPIVGKLKRI